MNVENATRAGAQKTTLGAAAGLGSVEVWRLVVGVKVGGEAGAAAGGVGSP